MNFDTMFAKPGKTTKSLKRMSSEQVMLDVLDLRKLRSTANNPETRILAKMLLDYLEELCGFLPFQLEGLRKEIVTQ